VNGIDTLTLTVAAVAVSFIPQFIPPFVRRIFFLLHLSESGFFLNSEFLTLRDKNKGLNGLNIGKHQKVKYKNS